MKNRLIRWLGGIPKPPLGRIHFIDTKGNRWQTTEVEVIIAVLGGVPLPKAGEGQHIVGPVVRNNPHRTKKGMNEMARRTALTIVTDAGIQKIQEVADSLFPRVEFPSVADVSAEVLVIKPEDLPIDLKAGQKYEVIDANNQTLFQGTAQHDFTATEIVRLGSKGTEL